MDNEIDSVYLTSTPYHILLSIAIAINIDTSKKKEIIIFEDFANAKRFASIINRWDNNPFDKVNVCKGSHTIIQLRIFLRSAINHCVSVLTSLLNIKANNIHKLLKYFIKINNVSGLKKFFKKNKSILKVFNFQDGRVESQVCEYLNHKRGGINIYVEDGATIYTNYFFPNYSLFSKLFYKIFFRPWHQFIKFHGDYKYTDLIMALRPNLVRKELKSKPIEKIPKKALLDLVEKGFINIVLDAHNCLINSQIGLLIVLPHSEFLQNKKIFEKHNILLKNILQIMGEENIYVKYHPREDNYYLNQLPSNVRIIPQDIPLELIYLYFLDRPPKLIMGDISTSLLTAKVLYDKIKVVSLIKLLEIKHFDIDRTFQKEGILMPSNVSEFKTFKKRTSL